MSRTEWNSSYEFLRLLHEKTNGLQDYWKLTLKNLLSYDEFSLETIFFVWNTYFDQGYSLTLNLNEIKKIRNEPSE